MQINESDEVNIGIYYIYIFISCYIQVQVDRLPSIYVSTEISNGLVPIWQKHIYWLNTYN